MAQIRVLVAGAAGRMGCEVVRAVCGERDMTLAAAVDRARVGEDVKSLAGVAGGEPIPIVDSLAEAIERSSPEVMVDFTLPEAVMGNLRTALRAGVACLVGTSGLKGGELAEIEGLCAQSGAPCLVVPNFAIGAVLMMQFAARAARYFSSAEIVELHHADKVDAPSGTALRTARMMAEAEGSALEGKPDEQPARGETAPGGIHIHSLRLPGLVAHQEVIFGGLGQTLTIRHDSISRESFMPGVLLGIRKVRELQGLTVGLEEVMS